MTWKDRLRALGLWMWENLMAPGVALLVVVLGVVLVSMGWKDLQIGGWLGKLLGRTEPGTKALDVANSIPPGRVDAGGNLIPVGQPDEKGHTQAVVVPIKEPGLFSDPTVVTIVPPGSKTPIDVELPKGVKAKDVETVVVLSPDKFVVTVKDSAPVPVSRLDDILNKYGG